MLIDKPNINIQDDTENVFKAIVVEAYELYDQDDDFLSFLEKVKNTYGHFVTVAVIFHNFNDLVTNRGLFHYYRNDYHDALSDLISDFQTMGLHKTMNYGLELLKMLEKANEIIVDYHITPHHDSNGNSVEVVFKEIDFNNQYAKISIQAVKGFNEVCRKVMNIEELIVIKDTKPFCKLIGEDGNVYNLINIVSNTMQQNGLGDKVSEMVQKATSGSYGNALCVFREYVKVG